ncbi:MAG: antirestriction protein ArdA [Candidatus Dechloromonas phosphoritropha]|nr:antirestriction protein ArdA [Candidatus Dechloromonas phosphoritropha]
MQYRVQIIRAGTTNRAFYYVDGIPTKGYWIDLDDVYDTDEVLTKLVQSGIAEPDYGGDLLVADVEGALAWAFYSSCCDSMALDDFNACRDECDDENAAAAFIEWFGTWDANTYEEAYQGLYDNEEAFAEQLIEDTGMLAEIPEHLQCYFDYGRFTHDLFITDYYFADDGYVFNRNV